MLFGIISPLKLFLSSRVSLSNVSAKARMKLCEEWIFDVKDDAEKKKEPHGL